MALPVSTIIQIADVSQYLAQIDIDKGSLYGARKIPITPQVLYAERKAVEWLYNLDPNNDTLRLTANYLYSLCRGYNLQAQAIINSGGGGSISPVTPSAPPSPIEFNVASTGTPILDGQSSATFTQFIGFNLTFYRGGLSQSMLSTENSYFSWNRTTGLFTCYPAATVSELFQLIPV